MEALAAAAAEQARDGSFSARTIWLAELCGPRTVKAMQAAGWIEPGEQSNGYDKRYRVTPSGHAAVAEHKAAENSPAAAAADRAR